MECKPTSRHCLTDMMRFATLLLCAWQLCAHTFVPAQDGSGSLSYDEFSGTIFKLIPSVKNDPNSRSVVERVRAKIASRGGLNGIRTLGRILRSMDDSGNGKLDRYEMMWGMKDYGVEMSEKVCTAATHVRRGFMTSCGSTYGLCSSAGNGRADEGLRSEWRWPGVL